MTLDDERVQFYLQHREQLEEWFDLRTETAAAVDAWLTSLFDDLESLATELGPDVRCEPDLDRRSDALIVLMRSTWPGRSWTDAVAAIGIEWNRADAVLHGSNAPDVFVWCEKGVARAIRDNPEFRQLRRPMDKTEWPNCPAWHYVLPVEPFPEKADDYRRILLNSITSMWNAYAPLVDKALSA